MAQRNQHIWIAGGGTGGHLFPALAVADELQRRRPGLRILFLGGHRGLEQRLVPQAGYPLRTLRMSGLKGLGPVGKLVGAATAALAVLRCCGWMLRSRPDLVIGVGGYASGPAVLAARLLRVRTMVLEQNHFPGATNRWLAPRVDTVCVPSDAAVERLGGIGVVTGNPVRPEFTKIGPAPNGDVPFILVFGGSRGAHTLNVALAAAVPYLARLDPAPRILHQTGPADEATAREAARDYPAGRYDVHAFLDDLPRRLAAADLVVCRAGATTLAEIAAAGRPAVLVPYPFAADDHQRHNAEAVAAVGGALVVLDADLDGAALAATIGELLDDPERRARMAAATRTLARPDAAAHIADLAETLLGSGATGAEGGRVVS